MNIITTIDELKEYVEVANSLKFDTIKPSIALTKKSIKSCVGDELYIKLIDAYSDSDFKVKAMPVPLKALAMLVQGATANISMSLLVSRISVSVSDSGIIRNDNESQKTAYQYQEVNLRESYLRAGNGYLDDILIYLENNKSNFPEWVSSPSFLDYNKYFIRSSEQFSSCYNINESRLAFMSVRYIMKRIEDFQVKDIVGSKLFKVLKEQLKSDTVTIVNKILLDDFIRPGVALITISKGVWERALDISENGVSVSVMGSSGNNQLRQEAAVAKQQKMADQLLADGNEYLSRMGVFLDKNIVDYPDFEIPKIESHLFTIKNKIDNGIYSV